MMNTNHVSKAPAAAALHTYIRFTDEFLRTGLSCPDALAQIDYHDTEAPGCLGIEVLRDRPGEGAYFAYAGGYRQKLGWTSQLTIGEARQRAQDAVESSRGAARDHAKAQGAQSLRAFAYEVYFPYSLMLHQTSDLGYFASLGDHHLCDKKLCDVIDDDISQLHSWLCAQGEAGAEMASDIVTALKRMFDVAIILGLVKANPALSISRRLRLAS